MTKAEQAALAEMDTTPERIAKRQEHISQLLNGELHPDVRVMQTGPIVLQRKPRKDKGIPRQKAPAIAQQPGKITLEEYGRLNDLILSAEDRRREYEIAADNECKALDALESAIRERNAFIDELAGKKTG